MNWILILGLLGTLTDPTFGFLDSGFIKQLAAGFGLFGIGAPPVVLDQRRDKVTTPGPSTTEFYRKTLELIPFGGEREELSPRRAPSGVNSRFRTDPPWIRQRSTSETPPGSQLERFVEERDLNWAWNAKNRGSDPERPSSAPLVWSGGASIEFGHEGGRSGRSREVGNNGLDSEEEVRRQMAHFDDMLKFEMSQRIPSDGIRPFEFNNTLFPDMTAFRDLLEWGQRSTKRFAICNACRVAFGLFRVKVRSGHSLESLTQMANFACTLFRISSTEVCSGLVELNAPIIYYIAMHRELLTAEAFCGTVLQSFSCGVGVNLEEWTVSVPYSRGIGVRKTKRQVEFTEELTPSSLVNTIKILQLTDLHIDPAYKPGSNSDCENELCCREGVGFVEKGTSAGFYGDLERKCDLPLHTLENALGHISKNHRDVSLIYMTGDLVPHNVWATSVEENTKIIQTVSARIFSYFPNTLLIPVLGNHETSPVNQFSPFGVHHNVSSEWVYSVTARAWSQWIPRESIHSFLQGGYYSIEINPQFRVIVLNTNLCYTYNFWLTYESRDPAGMLTWLVKELQRSEDKSQYVHILGHVPPSAPDCYSIWSRNYYRIINRYRDTVTAQFFGHTHFDELKLYYSADDRELPISPLFNGPSLTTYTRLNPGYKIYSVDGSRAYKSTWKVLDFETWIFNLVEANSFPARLPRWFRLFRATQILDIPNVLPHSLAKLVLRMTTNSTLFDTFLRVYHKGSDVSLTANSGCDTSCRKRLLCNMISVDFDELQTCLDSRTEHSGEVLSKKNFDRLVSNPRLTPNSGQVTSNNANSGFIFFGK